MERGGSTENTVKILEIRLSSAAHDLDVLLGDTADFFDDARLCAAVVVLSDEPEAAIPVDRVSPICDRLAAAPVPSAAVFRANASSSARALARACLFQFAAKNDDMDDTVAEAFATLRGLTAKRPRHVIAAVMTSLRNAETLPLEAALVQETELFCMLSLRNRHPKEEGAA